MKKMLVVVLLGTMLLGSMGGQAQAGDREWAVAGKVLTGLVVLNALTASYPTTTIVYGQPSHCWPPVAYAPPVVYRPVIVRPAPVVYRPVVVRRPRVVCRPVVMHRPREVYRRPVNRRQAPTAHRAAYRPGGRRRR